MNTTPLPPKRILLTNDDGIRSPGLWAAAEALAQLGDVTVVAPRLQSSGAGRSMPATSEGRIHSEAATLNGHAVTAYAVDGTPAQAVQHALVELLDPYPDLVVAGINYGENVGSGVTISGTVGAALEGASFGVPGLAVSLQTMPEYHLSHSHAVDFSTAAFFTRQFAARLLGLERVADLDVLKVEVPGDATPQTPWRVTRLSRTRYYLPNKPNRASLTDAAHLGYRLQVEPELLEPDSDVGALVDRVVSVTPLSLDLTSRVDLSRLADQLRAGRAA
ncbi:MAG: 5'/3'-nucleotidase SurE [Anaerolineales bacterium]|nr:5'/3'-nucleotidase SurE [Anaerolineales bacterium]